MKKLIFFWKELLTTFWFLPVMLICSSIFLSIVFVSVDKSIELPEDYWMRFFLVTDPNSARSILSTISGAMIGVAGTVFSVTLVALTLASSQFGPRLIKNFMYVKLNQVVLGSYIATYLYCLLILNSVKDNEGYTFIPSFSILLAIFAAIVNIVLLIVFIHQIATSIQADKVVADISDFITDQLDTLYTEKMGDEKGDIKLDVAPIFRFYRNKFSIKAPISGYLQYVSSDDLFELISKENSLLTVHHRPGSFLVQGTEIAELQTDSIWEQEKIESLLDQFVIGKTKTPQQDLEYSIHQMVEIAVRALSPGINDPYTALSCIDNLTSTMSYLAQIKFPSKNRLDEEGVTRIIAKTFEFEGLLNVSFNQIRQYSGGSTAVIIRLIEALITIQDFTSNSDQQKAVSRHIKMVLDLGERTIEEPNDLEDLRERAEDIVDIN